MFHTADWGAQATLGYRLLAGRWFTKEDVAAARPLAVINQSLARAMHSPAEALGRQIRLPRTAIKDVRGRAIDTVQVIGVIADTPNQSLRQLPMPMLQVPSTLTPRDEWVALRVAGDATAMIPAMQREMASIAPGVSFYWIDSFQASLEEELASQRFALWLLGIFASIGTMLLITGLYGVMSYAVAQRTYELGVRIALGASASNIFKVITARGLALIASGVFIGAIASLALSRMLQSQLGDMSPADPLAYLAAGALLLTTALLAILIPGARALRISPARVLRHE
jgi:putative ABC transport system permease protein